MTMMIRITVVTILSACRSTGIVHAAFIGSTAPRAAVFGGSLLRSKNKASGADELENLWKEASKDVHRDAISEATALIQHHAREVVLLRDKQQQQPRPQKGYDNITEESINQAFNVFQEGYMEEMGIEYVETQQDQKLQQALEHAEYVLERQMYHAECRFDDYIMDMTTPSNSQTLTGSEMEMIFERAQTAFVKDALMARAAFQRAVDAAERQHNREDQHATTFTTPRPASRAGGGGGSGSKKRRFKKADNTADYPNTASLLNFMATSTKKFVESTVDSTVKIANDTKTKELLNFIISSQKNIILDVSMKTKKQVVGFVQSEEAREMSRKALDMSSQAVQLTKDASLKGVSCCRVVVIDTRKRGSAGRCVYISFVLACQLASHSFTLLSTPISFRWCFRKSIKCGEGTRRASRMNFLASCKKSPIVAGPMSSSRRAAAALIRPFLNNHSRTTTMKPHRWTKQHSRRLCRLKSGLPVGNRETTISLQNFKLLMKRRTL